MFISKNSIAITGLGCRFPGANNINEYWHLLRSGINAISYFSKEELKLVGIDPLILDDLKYVRARGILNNLENFDQEKLRFSDEELINVDLQARIFLHLVCQALEDAGIDPKSCPIKTAVFTGANESRSAENLTNVSSKRIHTMQPMMKVAYARSFSYCQKHINFIFILIQRLNFLIRVIKSQ